MGMRIWMAMLLGAGVLAATGCQGRRELGYPYGDAVPYNPAETGGDIAVTRDTQFADIPVPRGFRLRRPDSYSFRGNSFRMGTFHYSGTDTFACTSRFYLTQMAVAGWDLDEVRTEDPLRHEVQFHAKGKERCKIVLRGEENTEVFIEVYKVRDGESPLMASAGGDVDAVEDVSAE